MLDETEEDVDASDDNAEGVEISKGRIPIQFDLTNNERMAK